MIEAEVQNGFWVGNGPRRSETRLQRLPGKLVENGRLADSTGPDRSSALLRL